MRGFNGPFTQQPEPVADDHYLLTIKMKNTAFKPGQFINIKTTEGTDPLLRRPFSIFDADGEIVSIVVRVIGKGTELICEYEDGRNKCDWVLQVTDLLLKTGKMFFWSAEEWGMPLYII